MAERIRRKNGNEREIDITIYGTYSVWGFVFPVDESIESAM